MDHDDPEQRSAELEHQLSEQKRDAELPPASPDDAAASRRFEATGRWNIPRVICVTSDSLTVDKRPGDVFSLSEAKLCLWVHYGSTMGTALRLQCGSRRFVLGGRDHRAASGTRLEAPPVKNPHAWMWASDFDELLGMVAPQRGFDIPRRAPGEPIRCWLSVNPYTSQNYWTLTKLTFGKTPPALVIDVGQDAIWVMDLDKGAVVASAGLAQVTATPAAFTSGGKFDTNQGDTGPILVVRVPGLPPLTIGCDDVIDSRLRFWWRGRVPWEKPPVYTVGATDWLTLVEKFGLARHLEDEANRGSGPQPVPWSGPMPTPATRDRRWLAFLPLEIMFAGMAIFMFYVSAMNFYESKTSWLRLALFGSVSLVISIVIFVFTRSRTGKSVDKR